MDAISALRIDAKNKTHTEKKKVSLKNSHLQNHYLS